MLPKPGAFLVENASATRVTQRMQAALAALAYKGDKIPEAAGIALLRTANVQSTGYDAAAYFHTASKTLLFVNRGAEGFRSLRDWIEGFATSLDLRFSGPLRNSVEFVRQIATAMAKPAGLAGITWDDVDEVLCTGHSWGGALAEAQVALGPAVFEALGLARTPTSGVGFGSAGFADAIETLSRTMKLEIVADMATEMDHYVRYGDPIRVQPNWHVLGDLFSIPSIYTVSQSGHGGSGKSPVLLYELGMPVPTEHDRVYYFSLFDVPRDRFIYKSHGKLYSLPGARPDKIDYGTVHPDEELLKRPDCVLLGDA